MTTEDEITNLKQRLFYLEGKIAALEHELAKKDIIKPTTYPPYYPWTIPGTPIQSDFAPSKWMCLQKQ